MKHLITILIVLSSSQLFSQHITNFGLFQQNLSFYNPSATAYQTNHFGTIQYKSGLTNLPGFPRTFVAQYEKELKNINSGIGFLAYNDHIGFSTYNLGMLQYRYSLKIGEESQLLFGISAGILHSKFGDLITTTNGLDTIKGGSQGKFTMNAGVSYRWKNLFVGISVMNATKPTFERMNLSSSIHYVAHANYDFEISEKFTVSPQVQLLTELIKMSATFNLRFEHYDRFWYMAGVQNTKTLLFGAGIQFWDRLYIGYLYEHFTNALGGFGPSHEAFVTFKINN